MSSVQNEELYNSISGTHGIEEQPCNFLNENVDNSNKKQVRRKPCGTCDGCKRTDNCGQCSPCLNSNSHQICKARKCYQLCSKSTENKLQRHCNLNSMKHGMQFVPLNVPPRNLVPRHPGQFIPLMQQGATHFQIGPTDQRPYQQMIHIN